MMVMGDSDGTAAEAIRDFTRRHGLLRVPCLDGCDLDAHYPLTCTEAAAAVVPHDHAPSRDVSNGPDRS